jgi:hypothetical protein
MARAIGPVARLPATPPRIPALANSGKSRFPLRASTPSLAMFHIIVNVIRISSDATIQMTA